jgi:hypothetical protein
MPCILQYNTTVNVADSSYVAVSSGIADIIQPSLTQLQPTIEETMDTLEPLPAYYRKRQLFHSPSVVILHVVNIQLRRKN